MKSYSQNGEDVIVYNYFENHVGPRTLLSIGENDGVTFSNAKLLIDRSWTAHLFEPSQVFENLLALHKNNQRVTVYQMGMAAYTGTAKFFESGAHVKNGNDRALVSTTVTDELKRWDDVDFKERTIEVITFADWWDGQTLDFITIDAEGLDYEILKQIDLQAVGCRCICLEWNSIPLMGKLMKEYCEGFGMKELHRNAENLIFVK